MKPKSLMGYTIAVAAVCAYVGWDYWQSQKEKTRKLEAAQLSRMIADQISKVSFHKPNEKIEVEKTVDGWKLVQPVKDAANSSTMDEFVEGILTEKSLNLVAEGDQVDLQKFGLDKPLAEIILMNNQGQSESFKVGQTKNFQGNAYLYLPQSQKIFTASSTWFTRAAKTSNELRDRRWMRKNNANTETLKVMRQKDSIHFQKKEGRWYLSDHLPGPDLWNLDQNKVRELLNKLNVTDAIEFIGEGKPSELEIKKWGFQKDLLKVEVYDSEKQLKWAARFAQGEDKITRLWVTSNDFLLKVNISDLQSFLEGSPDSFRDRKEPFQFVKSQVEKLKIHQGGQVREVLASSDRGRSLLKQISEIEVHRFEGPRQNAVRENGWPHRIEFFDTNGQMIFEMKWSEEQKLSEKSGSETIQRIFSWVHTSAYPRIFSILQSDINLLKIDTEFPETAKSVSEVNSLKQ